MRGNEESLYSEEGEGKGSGEGPCVGARIERLFKVGRKTKWFGGQITSQAKEVGVWLVTYDDGDEGTVVWPDISGEVHIVSGTSRSTKKSKAQKEPDQDSKETRIETPNKHRSRKKNRVEKEPDQDSKVQAPLEDQRPVPGQEGDRINESLHAHGTRFATLSSDDPRAVAAVNALIAADEATVKRQKKKNTYADAKEARILANAQWVLGLQHVQGDS